MSRQTDPTIRLARKIAADATALPRVVESWLTSIRLVTADGYGSGRPADPGPRAVNTISDPTGEQAARNTTGTGSGYGPSDEHGLVLDQLRIAAAALELAGRYASRRDVFHGDTPVCSGGHLAGAHIPQSAGGWCDPTCATPAELHRGEDGGYSLRREGLCEACGRRYRRWKERTPENVPTNNVSVTSGNA